MTTNEKVYLDIMSGCSDNNIRFVDICNLLDALGFESRIKGDHHIFSYPNTMDNINIQPKGNMAKPYQVKQIRRFLESNRIGLGE